MNKTFKRIILFFGFAVLLWFGYIIYTALTFSFFDDDKFYSKQDLIDNYNTRKSQINDLKNYLNSIVPANKSVDIEFEGSKRISIFHLVDNGTYYGQRDLKLNSNETDMLLARLNWTQETLKTLKEKLGSANCISIESGEPCTIGFQRSGMGKYYYKLFETPIPDNLKNKYNDSCAYILYTDKVVLEYGGGAVGPQCF